MKRVVVFDVENVLFNVKYVEKWLKGSDERMEGVSEFERMEELRRRGEYLRGSVVKMRMLDGVKANVERLMVLKRLGRLSVYVVSEFRRELVWRLLEENGMEVNGIYESVGKMMEESGCERDEVVYFSGSEKRWCEGEMENVNNVLCGWGKGFEEGMRSMDGMWREIGVKVKGIEEEKEEVEAPAANEGMPAENVEKDGDIMLNRENIGEYGDVEAVAMLYRSSGGMSANPGCVWIMDAEGRDLGFNMDEDGMELEDAMEAIPSLGFNGPFAVGGNLGAGDCLTVDLYRWKAYEKKNLPEREDSCYHKWKYSVDKLFEMAAAGEIFAA